MWNLWTKTVKVWLEITFWLASLTISLASSIVDTCYSVVSLWFRITCWKLHLKISLASFIIKWTFSMLDTFENVIPNRNHMLLATLSTFNWWRDLHQVCSGFRPFLTWPIFFTADNTEGIYYILFDQMSENFDIYYLVKHVHTFLNNNYIATFQRSRNTMLPNFDIL